MTTSSTSTREERRAARQRVEAQLRAWDQTFRAPKKPPVEVELPPAVFVATGPLSRACDDGNCRGCGRTFSCSCLCHRSPAGGFVRGSDA